MGLVRFFSAVLLLTLTASSAGAQCAFDGPAKAKGFKSSFVRAFASCPGVTFLAPNSQTGTGVPTCAPPFEISTDSFSEKNGYCSLSMSMKLEDPCSSGAPGPCAAFDLKSKCAGIVIDGVTPTTYPGYKLALVLRMTIDDPDNGDMTIVDVPWRFVFQREIEPQSPHQRLDPPAQ